jgi:hypothetical protein
MISDADADAPLIMKVSADAEARTLGPSPDCPRSSADRCKPTTRLVPTGRKWAWIANSKSPVEDDLKRCIGRQASQAKSRRARMDVHRSSLGQRDRSALLPQWGHIIAAVPACLPKH